MKIKFVIIVTAYYLVFSLVRQVKDQWNFMKVLPSNLAIK